MMFEEDVTKLDLDIAGVEAQISRLQARLAGLRAERDGLISLATSRPSPDGLNVGKSLRRLTLTNAVQEVVDAADTPVRAADVFAALRAGGRSKDLLNSVSMTLAHLAADGKIDRVARGVYRPKDEAAEPAA